MSIRAPLHFYSRGEGSPLLLVHGFAGHGASWRRVAALLGESRTVAALTLPGHDPACPIPAEASFEELVSAIAGILNDTFDRPVEGVGYSLGARVLLGLLVDHGQRFERATLIGVHPGLPNGGLREERAAWDAAWAARIRDEGIGAFVDRWEELPLFATQRDLPDSILEEQRAIRRGHRPESLARAMTLLGLAAMPDYRSTLREIAIPIRLVAGERDAKFLALAREAVARLPNAELVVAPGAGHNVPLESPDWLAAVLRGDGESDR